jgi:CheY-like chemotaxis protein
MSATSNIRRPVVLVVEDEVWVLLDVASELEEHGYPVLCARNGDEALNLFADRDDISVVFTDINMPGSFNGLDLAREVRRRRPGVGLVITSGAYREIPDDGDGDGYDVFIPKPYEPKVVISRIGNLFGLHGQRASSDPSMAGSCWRDIQQAGRSMSRNG